MTGRIGSGLQRLGRAFGGSDPGCSHLDQARNVEPTSDGCGECLAIGGEWVHLRLCLACGNVGCCDNSPNRHARAHFVATGHPIIRSHEPGESWAWCWIDEVTL
jgi:hypothetical protein